MGQASSKTKKPLTMREAKFVKAKAQGLSNTKAAMIATGTSSVDSGKKQGNILSTKFNVQEAIADEFKRQGIDMAAIIKPIADGLTANKTVIIRDNSAKTPEESANSAFADEVADHGIRLKASGMAAQFLGFGKGAEGETTNFNFINVTGAQKDNYTF